MCCKSFGRFVMNLILACIFIQSSHEANILGVFTSYSPSHLIVHMSVVKALAERGHNVTVITCSPPIITHKDIRVIVVELSPKAKASLELLPLNLASKKNNMLNQAKMFINIFPSLIDTQLELFKSDEITQFLNTPDTKFDLLIHGYFFNDFQLALAAHFKCPIIVSWVGHLIDSVNDYIGNPSEISYVPHFAVGFTPGLKLTFMQRLENLLMKIVWGLTCSYLDNRNINIYKQLYGNKNYSSLEEIKKNISLVLANTHFSEGRIRPNVPALIEIGGIQVKEKPDPLPKDILEFIEKSKHGFVLFSLGSNMKSKNFPQETVKAVYNTLSNLKENVIWKWDELDNVPGHAKNILYKSWLPQDDLLAHPKLKLFITHAGKGGIIESEYHGVPMVALPIFADQNGNAKMMEDAGYGLALEFILITEEGLKTIVAKVLNNSTYRENVRKFSKVYRDRPLTAKENVVYWSEYVIRHDGALHIQSPLVHMNAIERSNLDIFAFLLIVIYALYRLFKLILKRLLNICKKQRKPKKKGKKQ